MSEDNLQKADRLYRSGMAPEVLIELVDKDALCVIEAPSLPFGGDYQGLRGMKALGEGLGATFSKFRMEYVQCVGSGDMVVVEAVMHFTTRATGQEISMPILEIVRFKDGKIVELKPYYFDTATLLKAINGN